MKDRIAQDIWDWIKNYIEANHKFYNYQFPPCPYARSARLQGLVDVQVYKSGNSVKFAQQQIDQLIAQDRYNVLVLVFPPRFRWLPWLSRFINGANARIAQQDFYAQQGTAIGTDSQYPGFFNSGEYFIVIINRLSDVLSAHNSLLKTDYYKPWADHHYDAVVTRRQNIFEKYANDQEKNTNS